MSLLSNSVFSSSPYTPCALIGPNDKPVVYPYDLFDTTLGVYHSPERIVGVHPLTVAHPTWSFLRWHQVVKERHNYTAPLKRNKIEAISERYGRPAKECAREILRWLYCSGRFEVDNLSEITPIVSLSPFLFQLQGGDNLLDHMLLAELTYLLSNALRYVKNLDVPCTFSEKDDFFGPLTKLLALDKTGLSTSGNLHWGIAVTSYGILCGTIDGISSDSSTVFNEITAKRHAEAKRPFLSILSYWSYYRNRWGMVMSLPWTYLNKNFKQGPMQLLRAISPPPFATRDGLEARCEPWWNILPPLQKYFFMSARPNDVEVNPVRHVNEVQYMESIMRRLRLSSTMDAGEYTPEYFLGLQTFVTFNQD